MTGRDSVKVYLSGGGPWGFRLQGGAGTGLPLSVSKVRRKSKAYNNLHEGDSVVSVNGKPCDGLTYDQVMAIVDASGSELAFEVIRGGPNKENVAPPVTSQTVKTTVTTTPGGQVTEKVIKKEEITTETFTKVTEKGNGLRVKSATLQADEPQSRTPSPGTKDRTGATETITTTTNKPLIPETTESDSSKSVTQEVSSDGRKMEKTTTETIREKHGNMEKTVIKKEHESVFKDGHPVPPSSMANGHVTFIPGDLTSRLDGGSLLPADTAVQKSNASQLMEIKKIEKETSEITKSSWQTNSLPMTTTSPELPPFPDLNSVPKSMFSTMLSTDTSHSGMDTDIFNILKTEGIGDSVFKASDTEITCIPRKKKMFSSSSFYEEPYAIYPTVEEQVELCRKIADSLSDDTNRRSRGANMFFRRVKKSSKWVHEGPETSDESPMSTPEVPVSEPAEPPTPDPSTVPHFSVNIGPPKLKLILDPRHLQDAISLRGMGQEISEHNVVSPDVCHDLVRDLQSPKGKGAALFAKRKKKSEDWVVDEDKVKAHTKIPEPIPEPPGVPPLTKLQEKIQQQGLKMVKSPWEAALESPIGSCEAAFVEVNRNHVAETIIRAAEHKRANSLPPSPVPEFELPKVSCTPSQPSQGDIYRPKAPRGWIGNNPEPMSTVPTWDTEPVATPRDPVRSSATLPRKMIFNDFNTVPRSWRSFQPNDPAGFKRVKPPV